MFLRQARRLQEDLEARERHLAKKEQRYDDVMQAQRDALMLERNTSIDLMREAGKADARTWVEGDQYTGVYEKPPAPTGR